MVFLLAVISAIVGTTPLLLKKRFGAAAVFGVIAFLITSGIYYLGTPSLVWPLWGGVGVMTLILMIIGTIIEGAMDDGYNYFPVAGTIASLVGVVLFIGSGMVGCGAFRDNDYKAMIGDVEKREWTKDVQPKDPRHVRLVPKELAFYLATKQFGEVQGSLGSQFQISESELTLQLVNGELWYIAPLEFREYSAWTDAEYSPGYVMVHGEDPKRQPIVKTGQQFRYMPSAYFGDNLDRHIWYKHYDKGLTDYSFEIDDEGNAHWVVTVFEPTIAWSGERALGVLIVDPKTGEDMFYGMDKIPAWVDRVVPKSFVESYVDWYGIYANDWLNSWWGKKDVFEGGEASIIYGSDGDPYWVTDITSTNANDLSMIGLIYTNTRTGKSVRYHAVGGTDEAVLQLVDNKVSYRKLHGASPVLYNVYGVMTSIVPLLGEAHNFQGVAFVDIEHMQLAEGPDQISAFREYQKLITTAGQALTPDKTEDFREIDGLVDRFASETRGGETVHYVHIVGYPHVFTGSGNISPELPITHEGDKVKLRFLRSDEDVVALIGFDNAHIVLHSSAYQRSVRERVSVRGTEAREERDTRDARGTVNTMSDEEVRELVKLKNKK